MRQTAIIASHLIWAQQFKNFISRGRFHKSWAQGANHRDSSIHLRPTPTPNFLRSFLLAQSWALRFALCAQLYEIDPRSLCLLRPM